MDPRQGHFSQASKSTLPQTSLTQQCHCRDNEPFLRRYICLRVSMTANTRAGIDRDIPRKNVGAPFDG
jgi:hypothetical protein